MKAVQVVAAQRVAQVLAGHRLVEAPAPGLDAEAQAALRDLAFGTLRHLGPLRETLASLAQRGPPPPLVAALLLVALYQLGHTRAAPHAITGFAVDAVRDLGQPQASGFVNAALRRYLRERDALDRAARATAEGRWSHPRWWIERLHAELPDAQAAAVLDAGNTHPPMTLRVNRRRTSRDAEQAALAAAGIETTATGPSALRLARPLPMRLVPGHAEGRVSVQDRGAQFAAELLAPRDGERVLDACAAPGGKAMHLLETAAVDLLALDADATRLGEVQRQADRLGLHGLECRHADAGDVASWWDGRPFDRILLDAPCSASGIVRRHPDAKWLRRETDLASFARTQAALLAALWVALRPGGTLIYVTCSVFDAENAGVVRAFLSTTRDAAALVPSGLPSPDGRLFPTAEHDGFFHALLQRRSTPPPRR